jgi:hypothetical protein
VGEEDWEEGHIDATIVGRSFPEDIDKIGDKCREEAGWKSHHTKIHSIKEAEHKENRCDEAKFQIA